MWNLSRFGFYSMLIREICDKLCTTWTLIEILGFRVEILSGKSVIQFLSHGHYRGEVITDTESLLNGQLTGRVGIPGRALVHPPKAKHKIPLLQGWKEIFFTLKQLTLPKNFEGNRRVGTTWIVRISFRTNLLCMCAVCIADRNGFFLFCAYERTNVSEMKKNAL